VFCTIHSDTEAVGVCVSCGDALCEECVAATNDDQLICRMCELLYTVILLDAWGVLPEGSSAGELPDPDVEDLER